MRKIPFLTGLAGAFGIACLLSAGVLRAEEHFNEQDVEVQLPEFFDELDLTDEQREEIKDVAREYHQKMAADWARFHALHMKAVSMEASLLASVEGTMTEEQREQFRQALRQQVEGRRHRAARIERNDEPPPARPGQPRPEQPEQPQLQPQRPERPQPPERPQQPVQPQERDAPPPREALQPERELHEGERHELGERPAARRGVLVIGIAVRSPEEYIDKAELTEEERARLQAICAGYETHLRPVWSLVQAQHLQMVKHEADKIAAIEEILTEEQLQQLKQMRLEQPPDHPEEEVFIEAEEAPDTVEPAEDNNDEE